MTGTHRKKAREQTAMADKPLFWRVYLWVLVGLGILLVISAVLFWSWLADYQNSQRTKVVEGIVSLLEKGEYERIITENKLAGEEFEGKDGYAEQLKEAVGDEAIRYVKAFSADRDEKPMFYIMAGEKKLLKAVLRPQKETSFYGFRLYELDYLTEFSFAKEEVKIVVPEGCKVMLNGKPVSSQWVEKTDLKGPSKNYALLEGAEELTLQRYHVSGLLAQPEITVEGPDNQAIDLVLRDGEYVIPYLTLTLSAPSNAQVFVNGQSISGETRWRLEGGTDVVLLQNVPEGYINKPSIVQYRVTGFLTKPEIQVINCIGEEVVLTENPEKGTIEAGFSVGADTHETYRNQVVTLSQMYSKFVTNDVSKWTFLDHILRDSKMYQDIYAFTQSFYTDHFKYWFDNVVTENMNFYTDECFSCEISYDHWIQGIRTNPDLKENLESHFRFVFVKDDGEWYLSDWEIL